MSRDKPGGAELLDLAREALMRDLLPHLPEERRRDALMVASAIAIARRELERAPPAIDAVALAAEIRAGAYDAPSPQREATRVALWALVKDALRIANPKLLAAHGLE
jgi:hypothetical protein